MPSVEQPWDGASLTPEHDARDGVRPIWTHKWLILAIVVLATGASYAYLNQRPKRFEASTQVYFQDSSVAGLLNPNAASDPERNLQNQARLLKSRAVAAEVAKQINYPGSPASLLGKVTVRMTSGSDFLTVTGQFSDANTAAKIANAFANAFIQIRTSRQRREIDAQLSELTVQLRRLSGAQATSGERQDLRSSIRDLQLARSLPSASAQLVDPALAPGVPVYPRPKRGALFAFFVALLGAVGLAYLLERFDRRLRRVEDVESMFREPLLAVIPESQHPAAVEDGMPALSPGLREPFRTLRTNLELAGLDQPVRTILVVSAGPNAGKSTIVRNLALAFREAGSDVAVVDADFRRPSMSKQLGVESHTGFVNVLTGQADFADALVPVTAHGPEYESSTVAVDVHTVPGGNGAGQRQATLSLLAGGPPPADPQAMLSASRTHDALSELAARHDLVLIDTPPLLAVSDAIPLLNHVDGVVVVTRMEQSSRKEVLDLQRLIARVPGVRVLGVVVNGVPPRHRDFQRYDY
jgi:Mrp family chromosome partitioning ATPase/capsular polysaccharide biosynthesis protein